MIAVLGAEKQAAVSAALAYPERQFLFVSEAPVIDGWDLPNVRIVKGAPGFSNPDDVSAEISVPCCPRWLRDFPRHDLAMVSRILGNAKIPFLPVLSELPDDLGDYVVKGNTRHRPDAVIHGSTSELTDIADPHGCGVVYQRRLRLKEVLQVIGRRSGDGFVALAVVKVLGELHCREEFLMAGETIRDDRLAEISVEALERLRFSGFFALNWVSSEDGAFISSMRPVAKAVFGIMRRAGADMLSDSRAGTFVASAGHRFVADFHYASYKRLT